MTIVCPALFSGGPPPILRRQSERTIEQCEPMRFMTTGYPPLFNCRFRCIHKNVAAQSPAVKPAKRICHHVSPHYSKQRQAWLDCFGLSSSDKWLCTYVCGPHFATGSYRSLEVIQSVELAKKTLLQPNAVPMLHGTERLELATANTHWTTFGLSICHFGLPESCSVFFPPIDLYCEGSPWTALGQVLGSPQWQIEEATCRVHNRCRSRTVNIVLWACACTEAL